MEIKNYKLQVILALSVLAIIIYAFFSKETTLQNKMQDALEIHDHENALIFASSLLEDEPGNQEAVDVIKESGQILLFLQLAQGKLADLGVAKDQNTGQIIFYVSTEQSSLSDPGGIAENVRVKPEKVYEYIKNATAYVAKAKSLDVGFKTTLKFEKSLNEAQVFVWNILAANVLDVGKSVYSNVFNHYEKKSALIKSATRSEYLKKFLAVQSAWTPMETPIDKIKPTIEPLLNKMDDTGRLVADNKAGKAENLSEALLIYIQAVKESGDILLAPKGSYKDFTKLANNSINEYKKAKNNLKRALPRSANVNKFSKPVKRIVGYELFQNDSTVDLIKENKYFQGA